MSLRSSRLLALPACLHSTLFVTKLPINTFCATFSFTPASLAAQPGGLSWVSPGSFHFRPKVVEARQAVQYLWTT